MLPECSEGRTDVREPDADIAAADGGTRSTEPQVQPAGWRRPFSPLVKLLQVLRLAGPKRSRVRQLALAVLIVLATWLVGWRVYGWGHLVAGRQDLQKDHLAEALLHFQTALRIWPQDGSVHLLAARAARRMGDYELADYHLKASRSVPSLADQVAFERVLLRASKGEIDQVGSFCDALLQQNHPETPLILEALCVGNLELLRFGAASHAVDRWLEMSHEQPQATFLKGRLELQASNNVEAQQWLQRAVELDPERDDARLLLAGLHLDLGQAQEALPHLEWICRRQPDNVRAKARLGQALVLLGRPAEATPLLDEVIRERPDLASALLERGKLALREGELEPAEKWLRQACRLDPGDRGAHYQLLQCLKQQGKVKDARAIQTRLEEIDAGALRMHEIVTQELAERPMDPELQAELGELLLRVGATNEGLTWLNRALLLEPRSTRAHQALAKHYQSLGQGGKAQQHLALVEQATTGRSPDESK